MNNDRLVVLDEELKLIQMAEYSHHHSAETLTELFILYIYNLSNLKGKKKLGMFFQDTGSVCVCVCLLMIASGKFYFASNFLYTLRTTDAPGDIMILVRTHTHQANKVPLYIPSNYSC